MQGQQVVWRVARACGVRGAPLAVVCGCVVAMWWLVVVVCGAAWRRPRPARGKGSTVMRYHEPGRLLSLAATLMLLARRSTKDPPERREAVQRPRAGLLLRAPHHSSRRMALRYFTLSSSLCAETIGGAWEVRLKKNMERVRAMIGISFYLYEVGSARAPKGFPWWTAGMKIDPRVPNTLIRKDYSLVNFTNIFPVSTQGLDLSNSQ